MRRQNSLPEQGVSSSLATPTEWSWSAPCSALTSRMKHPRMNDRPRLESVPRFLLWQASRQPATLIGGVVFGVIWMICQAVWPYLLDRAIVEGVSTQQFAAVWVWC